MTIDQFVNYDIRLFWLSPLNFYYPDPAYAESQRSVPIWLMEYSFLKRELVFNINEMPLYNDIVAVRELETGEFRIIPYLDNSDCLLSKQSKKQKLLNFLFLNLIYPSNMFVYFIFIIFYLGIQFLYSFVIFLDNFSFFEFINVPNLNNLDIDESAWKEYEIKVKSGSATVDDNPIYQVILGEILLKSEEEQAQILTKLKTSLVILEDLKASGHPFNEEVLSDINNILNDISSMEDLLKIYGFNYISFCFIADINMQEELLCNPDFLKNQDYVLFLNKLMDGGFNSSILIMNNLIKDLQVLQDLESFCKNK